MVRLFDTSTEHLCSFELADAKDIHLRMEKFSPLLSLGTCNENKTHFLFEGMLKAPPLKSQTYITQYYEIDPAEGP